MVSEKPTRRSRKANEPVTIDLSAEETSAVAEPIRSNDTDEPVTPAENESLQDIESIGAATKSEDLKEDGVEASSEPSSTEETIKEDEAEEADTRAGFTAPPQPGPALEARPRQSPATSTLIASGIFGGIVALALAGSMKYAGYLPGATPAPPPAPVTDTSALSSQIASLQEEIATLRERPVADTAGLQARVEALETASGTTPAPADTEALAALKSDVDLLRSAVESTAGNDAELERRLVETEAKLNRPGAEEQVARAISVSALKSAIDRGGSFSTELETFADLAPDDPAIAELRKFSAIGVPSRAELLRGFPTVANAILDSVNQPDPNQGLASRLMASALSAVKVRRVGDVEGDTPEAIVARIENNLRSDNLEAAAAEWEKLPESAKAASQQFKQSLDGRIQVEKLVSDMLTRIVSGTSRQG
ncbi:COG4223 family protein [Rhizobium sp. LCM 4573]|uniref:COG4223 family protein n=1 Tax=Rhizobium sp. LCM 4573 TaxID=1848291 RepID=UPI0008DAEB8E|nr:mitofilin family membrane protein [Rhizobium sp. LCM 4573]OHV82127.1 hypothetical protein LCM4573_19220 [Rhizobium sp. LCM 4573]